jgi:hypothetical protein
MARVSQVYPSKNLSAADLNDQELTLTISGAEVQSFDEGTKLVIYFEEQEKGFVSNLTNSRIISGLYGDDTDRWIGERITLYPTETQYNGRMVDCIRVKTKRPRPAEKAAATKPAGKPARPMTQEEADRGDDDIPF